MNTHHLAGSPKNVTVRLAATQEDIIAVQRLRWMVFHEGGVAPDCNEPHGPIDQDEYDPLCDHLMAVATTACSATDTIHEEVVGTYRLLKGSIAEKGLGYYTAHEFELSRMLHYAKTLSGEPLEIGRSCVRTDFRNGAVIQALWRGLGTYVRRHQISLLFGCASFPGTDPAAFDAALSLINHDYLAPLDRRPRSLSGDMPSLLLKNSYDPHAVFNSMPPLIKGYLRAGAKFGEGVYVDTDFNTVDVCALVETEALSRRYLDRFSA